MDDKQNDTNWVDQDQEYQNYVCNDKPRRVIITDIKIPFIDLMLFLVKLLIAALPAIFIAALIITIIFVIVTGTLGGFVQYSKMSG